jgi:hypothetical protein
MTNPQEPGNDPTWQQPGAPPPSESPQFRPPQYDDSAYGAQPGYPEPTYAQPVDPTMYQQQAYAPPPGYVYARPTNSLAIAALVCSLAGLATGISAPVGAILGHIARKQIAQTGEQGDGMALAGIIVGWVVTGIFVCVCVGYFGILATVLGGAGLSSL